MSTGNTQIFEMYRSCLRYRSDLSAAIRGMSYVVMGSRDRWATATPEEREAYYADCERHESELDQLVTQNAENERELSRLFDIIESMPRSTTMTDEERQRATMCL